MTYEEAIKKLMIADWVVSYVEGFERWTNLKYPGVKFTFKDACLKQFGSEAE